MPRRRCPIGSARPRRAARRVPSESHIDAAPAGAAQTCVGSSRLDGLSVGVPDVTAGTQRGSRSQGPGTANDAGAGAGISTVRHAAMRTTVRQTGGREASPRNANSPSRLVATGAIRKNRRRPTLPGPCGPSTIGAERLNGSVRNGKRCFPLAITTGNFARPRGFALALRQKRRERALHGPSKLHSMPLRRVSKIRQALEQLVPVSYECYHSSRSGLSTWWSSRVLTPSRGWESSS